MLLFIIDALDQPRQFSDISKHRILLFIDRVGAHTYPEDLFQNIVCYCLSQQSIPGIHYSLISKHRMLLFIFIRVEQAVTQFIISKHRMLLFINSRIHSHTCDHNFKTSYVTVYRKSIDNGAMLIVFQNIVCYCLSCNTNFIRI